MLTAIGIALLIGVVFVCLFVLPKLGGKNTDEKLLKFQSSVNFKDGKFHNLIAISMAAPKFSTMFKFFSKGGQKMPSRMIQIEAF